MKMTPRIAFLLIILAIGIFCCTVLSLLLAGVDLPQPVIEVARWLFLLVTGVLFFFKLEDR